MPIGGGKRTGPIGGPARKGWIGKTGTGTGDSLGPGTTSGKARSSYWLKYPSTTTTTSSTMTTTSSSTTTTTAA